MVHAGAVERHLVERDIDQLAQVVHGPVDGVAHPQRVELGVGPVQVLDIHRHRVRVIQQPGVRRFGAHVRGQAVKETESPQPSEDPAHPERVRDGLTNAVAGRHLEVGQRGRVTPDAHRVDHEVGTAHRFCAVQRPSDGGVTTMPLDRDAGQALCELKSLRVDVVHDQVERPDVVVFEQVTQQLSSELGRASTDETDGGHAASMSRRARRGQDCAVFLSVCGHTPVCAANWRHVR